MGFCLGDMGGMGVSGFLWSFSGNIERYMEGMISKVDFKSIEVPKSSSTSYVLGLRHLDPLSFFFLPFLNTWTIKVQVQQYLLFWVPVKGTLRVQVFLGNAEATTTPRQRGFLLNGPSSEFPQKIVRWELLSTKLLQQDEEEHGGIDLPLFRDDCANCCHSCHRRFGCGCRRCHCRCCRCSSSSSLWRWSC